MKNLAVTALVLCSLAGSNANAAELKILPAEITLTGSHASQRLIVLSQAAGKFIGDLTNQAKFVTANADVCSVDGTGLIRASGDGETTITVTLAEQKATAKVRVEKFQEPF